MPKRKDIKKILVIGSGPIIIGQAAEFDYAGTQACLALKEEGYEVILINSNPATIMTDKQVADVVVETLDNGNINFVLKNFMLGGSIAVGNIAVNDIEVATDGTFAFNGGIELTEGDATVSESWLGPSITEACKGSVPLDLSGKFIDEGHIIVYIFIDIALSLP